MFNRKITYFINTKTTECKYKSTLSLLLFKTLMEHDITLQFYRNNTIIVIYFIKKKFIIHIKYIYMYNRTKLNRVIN